MKVIEARSNGFCWGVKRATEKVLELSAQQNGPVYTYGPLIHNPQVLTELEEKNIWALDPGEKKPAELSGATVVVRAHGVTPVVKQELKSNTRQFMDLTCPLVTRISNKIDVYAKKDYDVIVVGDADHAETIGLLGFARGKGRVVGNVDEARALPHLAKVCVVAQSTQDDSTFNACAEIIRANSDECVIANTICGPTYERQSDTLDLTEEVDRLVVVGGRTSANTARLVKLAQERGMRTIWVEREDELKPEDFAGCEVVGVTSGLSTPTWMIQRVVDRLNQIGQPTSLSPRRALRETINFLARSHLFVAAGAAALTWACCHLQQIHEVRLSYLAIAALFVYAMHSVNAFVDRTQRIQKGITGIGLMGRSLLMLGASVIPASIGVAVLAYRLGWVPFVTVLVSGALGSLYGTRIIPDGWSRFFSFRRLKDFPLAKDLSQAAGWSLVTAVLPYLATTLEFGLTHFLVAAFAFLLAFARSVMIGVRDVQGDKIVGKETAFNVLGKLGTKVLMGAAVFGLFGVLAGLAAVGSPDGVAIWLFGLPVYVTLIGFLYHRRIIHQGSVCELAIDGQYLLAGACTALWLWMR